jgi:hypothetical protein
MIVSILLVLFLIAVTFYIHQQLTDKQKKHQLPAIRIPAFNNYNEILIDTPIMSPEPENEDGSIRRVSARDEMNDEDVISMGSDNMSMVSLEDDETTACNEGEPVELPRGFDQYQPTNDNARHIFSAQDQMRVFDRHDFVKEIGNGRVNVDTNGGVSLPTIRQPQASQQQTQPEPFPMGMSSLAGYGTLMARYGDNNNGMDSYMSGVVPYQG